MDDISRLQSNDWTVRRDAARSLGETRNKQAVIPLIAALKDRNSDVCKVAAQALGKIGDVRAVEPLIAILEDGYSNVHKAAAQALGQIGELHAIDLLLEKQFEMGDDANNVIRDISKRNVAQFQNIWQRCICQEHLTHFIRWKRFLFLFIGDIPFYACRVCQMAEPSYRNISQVIAVLDMSASQSDIIQQDNMLYVPWSLERGIFDFDAVEIRQATSSQIETFLLKFDEDEDPARPWKQKRGRKIQCRVLSTCPITAADRARLQRHFDVADMVEDRNG